VDGDGGRGALPGGKGLKIQTRLAGQNAGSPTIPTNMMFPVAETLVYLTQGITLEPGDIVFTGKRRPASAIRASRRSG